MVSKILAGVMAAAVLTVGGYAYWQNSSPSSENPAQSAGACPSQSTGLPPCCQEPSRISLAAKPSCCTEDENDSAPEVLAIRPRELK